MNRARSVRFHFDGNKCDIWAGPIRDSLMRRPGTFSVKLAPEIPIHTDLVVPVKDFGTPQDEEQWLDAAKALIRRGLNGRLAYVGCLMGQGRTGTMVATIAKIAGERHPVLWTRQHYRVEAVETQEQHRFVLRLNVAPVQKWLRRRAMLRRLTLGVLPW